MGKPVIADKSGIWCQNRYISGTEEFTDAQKLVADCNNDGEIDYIDVDIIRKFIAGWVKILPYDSGDQYTINYNLNDGAFEEYAYSKYAEISLPYTLEKP